MSARPSIAVTGLGLVSPLGPDAESSWMALLDGEVATRELSRFDTHLLSSRRGGEIGEVEGPAGAESEDGAQTGTETEMGIPRVARLARRAARDAVHDAAIQDAGIDRERFGVVYGTVMATRASFERRIAANGPDAVRSLSELELERLSPSSISRIPARALDLRGPNCVLTTACAAGNSAIAYAADLLCDGRADAMVAGGVDEISYAMLLMFNSFRALAPDAVRPFDLHRRGLMLAEGAGALVLEREQDARARGARILGLVAGYANLSDAHHVTAPHPHGRGARRAMLAALHNAGATPADVDYLCAHGTGTPANDAVEAYAVRSVFEAHADRLPVSSLKGSIGHAQGAASAIEAVGCVLTLRDGVIPATANHSTPDPGCELDVVAGRSRKADVRLVLNNAFGFGGNIECVAFAAA